MPAHIAEGIACLGAETLDGVIPFSPLAARWWHFFSTGGSLKVPFAVQLSYLLVGALCLERCDCFFSKLEPNTCTCRCVSVTGCACYLRKTEYVNVELLTVASARLPPVRPPVAWLPLLAIIAGGFGRSTWLAQATNSLHAVVRLSVAAKHQRVLRPAGRHCVTEHPVRSLEGVVNLHKHNGIVKELVLPLIPDGMKQSFSVVPCLFDSRKNRLQCGRSGRHPVAGCGACK